MEAFSVACSQCGCNHSIRGYHCEGVRIVPVAAHPRVEEEKDWIDLFVGLRIQADLTEKIALSLRGDIGGFDISDGSDFTWSTTGLVGYQFTEQSALWLGYKHLDVDYEEGTGSNKFAMDMSLSWPVLGFSYRF